MRNDVVVVVAAAVDKNTRLKNCFFFDRFKFYCKFQIFLLLFILLYVGSFALIGRFRRRDKEDLCSTDDDEILVYKIR